MPSVRCCMCSLSVDIASVRGSYCYCMVARRRPGWLLLTSSRLAVGDQGPGRRPCGATDACSLASSPPTLSHKPTSPQAQVARSLLHRAGRPRPNAVAAIEDRTLCACAPVSRRGCRGEEEAGEEPTT